MHTRAEEHKPKKQEAQKCSIPFSVGGNRTANSPKLWEEPGGGTEWTICLSLREIWTFSTSQWIRADGAKKFSAGTWLGLFAPPCGQMALLQQYCVKFPGSLKVKRSSTPVLWSQASHTFNPQCRYSPHVLWERNTAYKWDNTKLVFLYINVT